MHSDSFTVTSRPDDSPLVEVVDWQGQFAFTVGGDAAETIIRLTAVASIAVVVWDEDDDEGEW